MPRRSAKLVEKAPRYRRHEPEVRKQQLITAAIECLADGGMASFTIEQICRRAGISRGLISHHFDGKDALLAAAYDVMTQQLDEMASAGLGLAQSDPAAALRETIEANFAEAAFNRTELKAWLALWGEVASNPDLRAVHRKRYARYHAGLAAAISGLARQGRQKVNADRLATMFIALIDGVWLEWCLDAKILSQDEAKAACYALLEPYVGSLRD